MAEASIQQRLLRAAREHPDEGKRAEFRRRYEAKFGALPTEPMPGAVGRLGHPFQPGVRPFPVQDPDPATFGSVGDSLSTAVSPAGPQSWFDSLSAMGDRFNEDALLGAPARALDIVGLSSPEERATRRARNPAGDFAGGTTAAAFGMNPLAPEQIVANTVMRPAQQLAEKGGKNALARVGGGAAGGAATAVGVETARAGVEGRLPEAEELKMALGMGSLFGGVVPMVGAATKPAAALAATMEKRNPDLAALRTVGSTPTPIPGLPVTNSPAKRRGVQPTDEGRTFVATEGARKLTNELPIQRREAGQRLRGRMNELAPTEGQTEVSVNQLIDKVREFKNGDAARFNDKLMASLNQLEKKLLGQVEGSMELWPVNNQTSQIRRPGGELKGVPDPDYGTDELIGYDRMDGTPIHGRTKPLNRSAGTPSEEVVEHVGGGDPLVVPTGDIRGRVGDDPNHYLTINQLNELRDTLDAATKVGTRETGIAKKDFPLNVIAQMIRGGKPDPKTGKPTGLVPEHGPGYAAANREYHEDVSRGERARDLMETDNPERLGMQIKSLGTGKGIAGARKMRLENLRKEFPQSDRVGPRELRETFDDPRAILAEERMELELKDIPLVGPLMGQPRRVDIQTRPGNPLVARGIYGPARGAEELGLHLDRIYDAPEMPVNRRGRSAKVSALSLALTPFELLYMRELERLNQQ